MLMSQSRLLRLTIVATRRSSKGQRQLPTGTSQTLLVRLEAEAKLVDQAVWLFEILMTLSTLLLFQTACIRLHPVVLDWNRFKFRFQVVCVINAKWCDFHSDFCCASNLDLHKASGVLSSRPTRSWQTDTSISFPCSYGHISGKWPSVGFWY